MELWKIRYNGWKTKILKELGKGVYLVKRDGEEKMAFTCFDDYNDYYHLRGLKSEVMWIKDNYELAKKLAEWDLDEKYESMIIKEFKKGGKKKKDKEHSQAEKLKRKEALIKRELKGGKK